MTDVVMVAVLASLIMLLLLPQGSEKARNVIGVFTQHVDMDSERRDSTSGYDSKSLTKRARVVSLAVFQGLKAAKYLLKGCKPLAEGDKLLGDGINEFVKAGGHRQATLDFQTIKPSNIREYGWPGRTKTWGTVGDRVIILDSKGLSKSEIPMMEIIKGLGTLNPHVAVIYYIL